MIVIFVALLFTPVRSDETAAIGNMAGDGVLLTEKTTKIGDMPSDIHQMYTSPDARRIVYRTTHRVIVVDGKANKSFDGFDFKNPGPIFSPDSKRVAYKARRKGKWHVVCDGNESEPYNAIEIYSPVFSPDSKRMAFIASRGGKMLAVVDGIEGKEYDKILGSIVFSHDSEDVAYIARQGAVWHMVINGTEGPAREGMGGEYGTFVANPCRKGFAYTIKRGANWILVNDDRESKPYASIAENSIRFSPDGKRIAYVAGPEKALVVVVDDDESKEYMYVFGGGLGFSPNSERIGYCCLDKTRTFNFVVDGKPVIFKNLQGMDMNSISFSPDGNRAAFIGMTKDGWPPVIDGVVGEPYKCPGRAVFSPDSKHVAYCCEDVRASFLILDGVKGKEYDSTGNVPVFSPDGKHLVYQAREGDTCWVIVDGKEHGKCDFFPGSGGVVFDTPTSFHTIAVSKREFVVLEFEIQQP